MFPVADPEFSNRGGGRRRRRRDVGSRRRRRRGGVVTEEGGYAMNIWLKSLVKTGCAARSPFDFSWSHRHAAYIIACFQNAAVHLVAS